MESRYQPHLSQQLHMPVYCAICDLSSACLICNPESAPFSEVTAFRAGTVNVAQLPATPLSLAAASESTRTALDCEDASWVRSLPRDVDETILPFVDAESPLVWPPLPAAERERKAKGMAELEANAWALRYPGVWSTSQAHSAERRTQFKESRPAQIPREVAPSIGLGFGFSFGEISSLNEFKVAFAFERAGA